MLKVMLDTNVLVSALIQRSYPHLIINELLMNDRFKLWMSDELMAEYYEVLARPKFSRFPDFLVRAEIVLAEISSKSTHFSPSTSIDLITDQNDNRLLELAVESEANYIITGNTNDFTFSVFQQTHIISPRSFWEMHMIV